MTQKEINELKARVYSISNCMFPLDAFFNDIEKNKNQNYDKEGAYNDLKLITDAIYELREKLKEKEKEQDCTLEEVKKEWEEEGFEIISCSKERFEVYKQWIERYQKTSHHTSAKVVIEKDFFYIVGQFSNKYTQLLTKTIKTLEKEKENGKIQ